MRILGIVMNILILAAGEMPPKPVLDALYRHADWVIAADGGAQVARRGNIEVHEFIGDGDSITQRERRWLEKHAVPMTFHSPEKDETDLELALELAFTKEPDSVIILGAWGGRADHTLSNLFLLERALTLAITAELWAGYERLRLFEPGSLVLDASAGQRVSLIPISKTVKGVLTDGVQYPLHGETLRRSAGRGVSNIALSSEIKIEFTSGLLMVSQAYDSRMLRYF